MKYIQIHPFGSDETAPFDVKEFPETVKEFVDEVLKRKEDWGEICFLGWCPPIKYKQGELIDKIPQNLLDRKIRSVKAVGGWSYMSYDVILNPYQL